MVSGQNDAQRTSSSASVKGMLVSQQAIDGWSEGYLDCSVRTIGGTGFRQQSSSISITVSGVGEKECWTVLVDRSLIDSCGLELGFVISRLKIHYRSY
jgi:hypothetical protein